MCVRIGVFTEEVH